MKSLSKIEIWHFYNRGTDFYFFFFKFWIKSFAVVLPSIIIDFTKASLP